VYIEVSAKRQTKNNDEVRLVKADGTSDEVRLVKADGTSDEVRLVKADETSDEVTAGVAMKKINNNIGSGGKFMKRIILLISCLILTATSVYSQAARSSNVFNQPMGARVLGMGDAFVSVSDDINSICWNPAGLGQLKQAELSATYAPWLIDITNTFIGFGAPGSGGMAYGAAVSIYDLGSFDLVTANEAKTIKAEVDQTAIVTLAKSNFIKTNNMSWNAGINLKYLSSTLLEEYKATTFGVDVGVLGSSGKNTRVGLVVQNIGGGIKYKEETDPLPMTIRAGVSYHLMNNVIHRVTAIGEIARYYEGDSKMHLGFEYWYARLIAFRVGYKSGYDLESITYGLGINVKGYQFDYGFGAMSALGNVTRMSFTARF